MGRLPFLPLLFGRQRPDELARLLHYYNDFVRAHSEKLHEYQSVLAQLTVTETRLQDALRVLHEQQAALESQKSLLLSQLDTRALALKRVRGELNHKSYALQQYQRNRKELAKIIAAAQTVSRKMPPLDTRSLFGRMKGSLPWPVIGNIQNRFGSPRAGHMVWEGVMISAKEGTPVRAVHSGRVVFSDWLSGHGLLMILDHGDGYMTLYARNQVLLKDVGEWVQSGDNIARSGDTGGEEAAGLYFEIRYQGSPTDPRLWCRQGN